MNADTATATASRLDRVAIRVRSRMLVPVALTAGAGAVGGSAFALVLRWAVAWWAPTGRSGGALLVGLVLAAVAVIAVERWWGETGTVELLVDNIHVEGGAGDPLPTIRLLPLALLCIVAGGPLGPEAPLVQACGTIGSTVARRLRLRPEDTRTCTITGMAAAFAVLLGAPLGGAFFAIEILHRRGIRYETALLPAAVGGLAGHLVNGAVGGSWAPLVSMQPASALVAVDWLWALAAGTVGVAVALCFRATAASVGRVLSRIPVGGRPIAGAVAIFGLSRWQPAALTPGDEQLGGVLAPSATVSTLLAAAATKLLAVAIALGARWKGGVIVPALFAGVALGHALHLLVPGADAAVLSAAMMAALLVGVMRTPIAATVVVAEMTGTALLPTTLVAAVAGTVLLGLADRRTDHATDWAGGRKGTER